MIPSRVRLDACWKIGGSNGKLDDFQWQRKRDRSATPPHEERAMVHLNFERCLQQIIRSGTCWCLGWVVNEMKTGRIEEQDRDDGDWDGLSMEGELEAAMGCWQGTNARRRKGGARMRRACSLLVERRSKFRHRVRAAEPLLVLGSLQVR